MNSHSFSSATALEVAGDGVFLAEIDPEWTIGGKPNGGYLLGMLGRGATLACPHDHVVAASAHFVHSPEHGPATVRTELLRAGRNASQVRATLVQDGTACVEALFTVAVLDPQSKAYWGDGAPRPGIVPMADCTRIEGRSPTGMPLALMDLVDLRIEPADLGFASGAPSGRGHLNGWLELPGEAFDPLSLIYAVDSFPPATFDVEISGWVPTLELTVYVRALPAPGPVRVLQKAQLVQAQRVDEACFIWDSTGALVAHGTQLAGVRIG